MNDKRLELIELVELGYEYEALMNIGNGWQPYEGCQQNLLMILEDPDTDVHIVQEDDIRCYEHGNRYHILRRLGQKAGFHENRCVQTQRYNHP